MKKSLKVILSIAILMTFIITSTGFITIAVKSIKLNSTNLNIQEGKTYLLKVTFTPANTTNKRLIFSTQNKNVATVDKYGKIKGVKPGKTVVTVTSESNKKAVAKCNVVVSQTTVKYIELANQVNSIDDLPTWQGKKLKLSFWYAHGTNAPNIGQKASNDIFGPELERVTGVSLSSLNSIDNNGEFAETKMAKMIATNSYPDIVGNLGASYLSSLYKAGKIFALDDAIKNNMPNFNRLINNSSLLVKLRDIQKIDDKFLYLPTFHQSNFYMPYAYPDFDQTKYVPILKPVDPKQYYLWVRDDIIKQLYPNAKNQNEIEQVYVKNGKFTKEDMTDVTIKSFDDYKNLLQAIARLNLKEGNRKVWPTYTQNGTDNWDLLTVLNGTLNGVQNGSSLNHYTYYDVKQGKIVPTFKQKWFKDQVKFYVSLVWDKLAPAEAIIDNRATFEQKKNNGEYAVIYGNTAPPTDAVLKQGGKSYRYRKVMIDTELDYNKFRIHNRDSNSLKGLSFAIFNNKIKKENLEQVMNFLDFKYTKAGQKFYSFGPAKADLYKENSDGSIEFKDAKLQQEAISGSGNQFVSLGRNSWPGVGYFLNEGLFSPKVVAPISANRNPGMWSTYWNYGLIKPVATYPMLLLSPENWNYVNYVPEVKRFWDSLQSLDDAIDMLFTAKDEQEFEKLYADLLRLLETNGFTDKAFEQINNVFNEQNKGFIDDFKNWKPGK